MRAGSDIGYCDSEFKKDWRTPFNYTEEDIKANVEALGFKLNHVTLCEKVMDLAIVDLQTGIGYDYYDLEYSVYEVWIKNDFLNSYNEMFNKEDLEK